MIVTLNKEPLDLTLENEKNLEELISGLSQWLNNEGYEITGLVKDSVPLDIYTGSWKTTDLESVKLLDITAVPRQEKYISDLQTLYQYITLLHDSIKKRNTTLTKDLLKEIPIITGAMDFFFGKNNKQSPESLLMQNFADTYEEKGDPEEGNNSFLSLLTNISLILQNRVSEITSPFSELEDTSEALTELLPKISEISVLLQTGDDKLAIDYVLQFIELSEKLIRIFQHLKFSSAVDITEKTIEKKSFTDFYKDFNDILNELVNAFDINDSILIGDLMEYEIVPKTGRLLEYISLIKAV